MIRLVPNDLIAISSGNSLYHAVVLGRQALFGGSMCYVFHERSRKPREASYFLTERHPGFHAIVDWIGPNRESCVTRVAKGVDTSLYKAPGLVKHGLVPDQRTVLLWKIVDENFKEKKRARRLTKEEMRLPNFSCLSGNYALKLAKSKWTPEFNICRWFERRRKGRSA